MDLNLGELRHPDKPRKGQELFLASFVQINDKYYMYWNVTSVAVSAIPYELSSIEYSGNQNEKPCLSLTFYLAMQ